MPRPPAPRAVPPRPRHPYAAPHPAKGGLRSPSAPAIGVRATPGNTSSNSSNSSHGTTVAGTAFHQD
eukprot:1712989-Alexandrium_andersonii.AAC.1